jgi:hypothetical protein
MSLLPLGSPLQILHPPTPSTLSPLLKGGEGRGEGGSYTRMPCPFGALLVTLYQDFSKGFLNGKRNIRGGGQPPYGGWPPPQHRAAARRRRAAAPQNTTNSHSETLCLQLVLAQEGPPFPARQTSSETSLPLRVITNFLGARFLNLIFYSQRRPDRSIRPNHPRISIVPPAGAITVARSTPPKYLR